MTKTTFSEELSLKTGTYTSEAITSASSEVHINNHKEHDYPVPIPAVGWLFLAAIAYIVGKK